jgi:hypothetical protein
MKQRVSLSNLKKSRHETQLGLLGSTKEHHQDSANINTDYLRQLIQQTAQVAAQTPQSNTGATKSN